MWVFHGDTMSELIADTVRTHLNHAKPDAVLNIETHLFNSSLTCNDATKYDLDVGKNLWLNKQRWSRLIREYVPLDSLNRFIDQTQEIMNGEARLGATANMLFRDPDRYAKKHRWGGCLMGATFRGDNKKSGVATLTFYSRTTYIGYMGLLDAAIASKIATSISTTQPIAFHWHIASMQLHCFKTLPYIYSQPDLMAHLEKYAKFRRSIDSAPSTWRHLAKWYCKVLEHWRQSGENVDKFLSTEKYGPFRRIKRRWCEHKGYLQKHVPPSLLVADLDFSKAE